MTCPVETGGLSLGSLRARSSAKKLSAKPSCYERRSRAPSILGVGIADIRKQSVTWHSLACAVENIDSEAWILRKEALVLPSADRHSMLCHPVVIVHWNSVSVATHVATVTMPNDNALLNVLNERQVSSPIFFPRTPTVRLLSRHTRSQRPHNYLPSA